MSSSQVDVAKTEAPDKPNLHLDESGTPLPGCIRSLQSHSEPQPSSLEQYNSPLDDVDLAEVSPEIYMPLDFWHTRILQIEPGLYGQPLITQLLPVGLIHAEGVVILGSGVRIAYEALSYSWGYPALMCSIKCNGKTFPVNPGVFQALQWLRLRDDPRYLWIDAICVNQLDPQEKSSQIASMFSIFRKAARVIAWLGEDDEHTRLATSIDAFLSPKPPEFLRLLISKDSSTFHREAGKQLSRQPCLGCLTDVYDGLSQISQNPWFQRVWVRQEVFAARELVVQIGKVVMSWADVQNAFLQAASYARSFRNDLRYKNVRVPEWRGSLNQAGGETLGFLEHPDFERPYSPQAEFERIVTGGYRRLQFNPRWEHRWTYRGDEAIPPSSKVDLFAVLLASHGFQATDPRDFVYGIVGMTNANVAMFANVLPGTDAPHKRAKCVLPIDYTKSVGQVFQDAAYYLMGRDQSLEVLLFAWQSRPLDNLRLSSWAPDWRSARLLDNLWVSGSDGLVHRNNVDVFNVQRCTVRDDGDGLCIPGFIFGVISQDATGEIFKFETRTGATMRRFVVGGIFEAIYRDKRFKVLHCPPPDPDDLVARSHERQGVILPDERAAGAVPVESQPGDVLVLVQRLRYPLVLRHVHVATASGGGGRHYALVGSMLTQALRFSSPTASGRTVDYSLDDKWVWEHKRKEFEDLVLV